MRMVLRREPCRVVAWDPLGSDAGTFCFAEKRKFLLRVDTRPRTRGTREGGAAFYCFRISPRPDHGSHPKERKKPKRSSGFCERWTKVSRLLLPTQFAPHGNDAGSQQQQRSGFRRGEQTASEEVIA